MPTRAELRTCLDGFLEQFRRHTGMPGISFGVTDRDQSLYLNTFGYANLESRTRVEPDALFEIGSITKSFASIALLQLAESGRLDLDAPVTEYLPWFSVRSRFDPIRIRHLMSHTSGLPVGFEVAPSASGEAWAIRNMETSAPPSTFFYYSNVGYKLLGLVVERVSGMSFPDCVRSRILEPLGMSYSEPAITNDIRQRLAVGYQSRADDRPDARGAPLAPATWLEAASADGCIASTASDMSAYIRMLLNRGKHPGGRLLSEKSFDLLTEPVIAAFGGDGNSVYCRGLIRLKIGGREYLGHAGGMVGYVALILADMEAGVGAVLLTNGMLPDPITPVAYALQLARALGTGAEFGEPPELADPGLVPDASDYVGEYRSSHRSFRLIAAEGLLELHSEGKSIRLERRAPDAFCVPGPGWDRFLLCFARDAGVVVEATHGPDVYWSERYAGPTVFEHPRQWEAFPGHYRAWNPWCPSFRVVLRKGRLYWVTSGGQEDLLAPLGGSAFRIGADERQPERLVFGPVIDGKAISVQLSESPYYRTFTP